MKPAGLGRGLAALIGDGAAEAAPDRDQLVRLAPSRLVPNPEQPREVFATGALEELAASMRVHGVLVPLVARRDERGGYVLIAGERRWRAAQIAGLDEVPVVVRAKPPTAAEQLELALIENLQREDLDPIEAALGYQRLVQKYGHSQEVVARQVGKDRATVANALRLLKLPEAGLKALREGRISAGHARALLGVEDAAQFAEVLATVIARELSVRATERLVRALKKPEPKKKAGPDRAVSRLGDQLTRALGTRVQLKPRKDGGGSILIDWHDGEDLDRLVAVLASPGGPRVPRTPRGHD
jgi:ParB family transcriptional regulator, chromosome partitioning protein